VDESVAPICLICRGTSGNAVSRVLGGGCGRGVWDLPVTGHSPGAESAPKAQEARPTAAAIGVTAAAAAMEAAAAAAAIAVVVVGATRAAKQL